MSKKTDNMYLCINRCAMSQILCISTDTDSGGGYRLTPDKGGGSWNTIRKWKITSRMIKDMRREMDKAEKILNAKEKEQSG